MQIDFWHGSMLQLHGIKKTSITLYALITANNFDVLPLTAIGLNIHLTI
jgi:hypothetical protein